MRQFFSRGQSGMEYIITYGWAVLLILSLASVLFIAFSMAPDEKIDFSLEKNPDISFVSGKVPAGGGLNKAIILLQNDSGYPIEILGITSTIFPDDKNILTNGKIPTVTAPVLANSESQIKLENIDMPTNGKVLGQIIISYLVKDHERYYAAIINVSGTIGKEK